MSFALYVSTPLRMRADAIECELVFRLRDHERFFIGRYCEPKKTASVAGTTVFKREPLYLG
jgi:hypothetical protein